MRVNNYPMIRFAESDPFPFIEGQDYTLAESQEHARQADFWLGLRIDDIEDSLLKKGCKSRARNSVQATAHDKEQLWIGLASQRLLTPYVEIRALFEHLRPKPGETVVDLGAAYGRIGFVLTRHFPDVKFVGYEFVGERVMEGRRCLSRFENSLVELQHVDLAARDFMPALAEFYFLYDFGSRKTLEKTIHDLRKIAQKKSITVVGRGRECRDLIERGHPWLSQVVPAEHLGTVSIYRTHSEKETQS